MQQRSRESVPENGPDRSNKDSKVCVPLAIMPTSPAYTGAILHCFCGYPLPTVSTFSGASQQDIRQECIKQGWPYREPRIRRASFDGTLQAFDDDEIAVESRTVTKLGQELLQELANIKDPQQAIVDAVEEFMDNPESTFEQNLKDSTDAASTQEKAIAHKQKKDAEIIVIKSDEVLKSENTRIFGRKGSKGLKIIGEFRGNPERGLSKIQLIGKSSPQNEACLKSLCASEYLSAIPTGEDARLKGCYKLGPNAYAKKSGVSSGV